MKQELKCTIEYTESSSYFIYMYIMYKRDGVSMLQDEIKKLYIAAVEMKLSGAELLLIDKAATWCNGLGRLLIRQGISLWFTRSYSRSSRHICIYIQDS